MLFNLKSPRRNHCARDSKNKVSNELHDMKKLPIDLTGRRFGKLTAISPTGEQDKRGYKIWHCKCDCGNERDVSRLSLINGHVTTCRECAKQNIAEANANRKKRGKARCRLYGIWAHIKTRCQNPNSQQFNDYGGRGIRMCPEWEKYEAFREWAHSSGYEKNLTIDRIDVNGNYEPSNCRWIPKREQSFNMRKTLYIHYNGRRFSLAKMTYDLGLDYKKIYHYLNGQLGE